MLIFGCVSSAQSDANGASGDASYEFYGAFISLPEGARYLDVSRADRGLILGQGDVGQRLLECISPEYSLCYYTEDEFLTFVIPAGSLTVGQEWVFRDHKFKIQSALSEVYLIDVRPLVDPSEGLRFVFANGSINAFMFGSWRERADCPDCFNPRITYVWTGDQPFGSKLASARAIARAIAR